jgi:hypothetical protein
MLAAAVVCAAGCKTLPPPAHPYYCPFNKDASLTAWAADAIQQGIGKQTIAGVMPYPDNRAAISGHWTKKDFRAGNEAVTERVAGMLGGWDKIAAGSEQSFASVQDLATMLNYYRDNPHFAAALDATSMLYPELRSVYAPQNLGAIPNWGR